MFVYWEGGGVRPFDGYLMVQLSNSAVEGAKYSTPLIELNNIVNPTI